MAVKSHKADIAIIGGGIAGIIAASEILAKNDGRKVLLVDRDSRDALGGLANWAFGGMALVGTSAQKKNKIVDTPEIALKDWYSFADFAEDDIWPKAWAKYYIENSNERIFEWFKQFNLKFLPAVQLVERGLNGDGNSVPRYHILWGSSQRLRDVFVKRLFDLATLDNFELLSDHRVDSLMVKFGTVVGFEGVSAGGQAFTVSASHVIVATGGVGGDLANVRANWPAEWTSSGSPAPSEMYNGSHPSADGRLHRAATDIGGKVTHLDWMWNYAAGIPHPKPHFKGHGLSLVPTRSSLWLDHTGKRIGPDPLVTGFDTNDLCKQVALQEKPWTWKVMNWRIARKEFAISGAEHNGYIRDRKFVRFIWSILTASPKLIKQMVSESDQIVVAPTIEGLVGKMNAMTDHAYVDESKVRAELDAYNEQIKKGPDGWTDMQLKRLMQLREWTGDKMRTVMPRSLDTKSDMPYLAIRVKLISRKTLGGIQTDLDCRVLKDDGEPIKGLYAIGEAAGFGGGGASGKRSLEGTFLSGCVLTARRVADVI